LRVELQVRGFWYFLTPKTNVPVLRVKPRKSAADHQGRAGVAHKAAQVCGKKTTGPSSKILED